MGTRAWAGQEGGALVGEGGGIEVPLGSEGGRNSQTEGGRFGRQHEGHRMGRQDEGCRMRTTVQDTGCRMRVAP
jgi:hypothetical protein